MIFSEIKWPYLFKKTYFRICSGSVCNVGHHVSINNSRIIAVNDSIIEIANNVVIDNATIFVDGGKFIIGEHSIIRGDLNPVLINIEEGETHIGHHSKVSAKRFWIRFGGILRIGNYMNINNGSEVRCDESISIGSYNQISYDINIWDTNTHNILPVEDRRRVAEKYFPYFGKETNRPLTKPVVIGDDCWIGERASILKGSIIGNDTIVGYNTLIVGKQIPANSTVVNNIDLQIIQRDNCPMGQLFGIIDI